MYEFLYYDPSSPPKEPFHSPALFAGSWAYTQSVDSLQKLPNLPLHWSVCSECKHKALTMLGRDWCLQKDKMRQENRRGQSAPLR